MNPMGRLIGEDTLRFERLLPGPIERVWAYLTESEKRGTWLARGEMDLRPGGEIEFRFDHRELPVELGAAPEKYKDYAAGHSTRARVIAVEAPRLLEITWAEGEIYESVVRFELFERGDEVLLVLTHRGLKGKEALLGTFGGWHTHLDILLALLEGKRPEGSFWERHMEWEMRYEDLLSDGQV